MRERLTLLAFALVSLIWASTWYAIKVGYEGVTPLMGAALRFLLAALVLYAVMAARRMPLLPQGRRAWALAGFVGLVVFGLDYGLIYWGEQHVSSGLTSVLFGTTPLWTLLFASAMGAERLAARKLGGIALGLAGVVVLVAGDLAAHDSRAALAGAAAIVASAALAGVGTAAIRRYGQGTAALALNAPAMLVGGALLLGGAAVLGEPMALPRTAAAWGSIVYLALAGSALGFLLYTWLVRRWDGSRAAYVFLVTPAGALLLGALLLGEPLGAGALAGTALILGGVHLVNAPRLAPWRRAPAPAPAPGLAPAPVACAAPCAGGAR